MIAEQLVREIVYWGLDQTESGQIQKNLPSDLGEACLKVALFSFDPRQQSGCRVNHRLEVDCARTVSGCRCANPSRSKTWSRQA